MRIVQKVQSTPDYPGWSLDPRKSKVPVKTNGTEITVKKWKNLVIHYFFNTSLLHHRVHQVFFGNITPVSTHKTNQL